MAITKLQAEALNLADNFAFTGTVTGAGESNTPLFSAYKGSAQSSLSANTYHKITFTTEEFDPLCS